MADVQHYMTAKLNLADGTIVYPQVSLDNIVAAIDNPTLVTVVTKTGETISISDIPTAGTVASGDSLHVPTNGAVYTAVNDAYTTLNNAINTKQNTLVEGDNIIHIINGSTIMADITNLDVAGIDTTTVSNGVQLTLTGGNTVGVAAAIAGATTGVPGTVMGVDGVLNLTDGVIGVDIGSGLKTGASGTTDADKIVIDDAEVGTVLLDTRGAVSPVEDQVVTPGNLRGALSVGQAVDVTSTPYCTDNVSLSFDTDMLGTITCTTVSSGSAYIGFMSSPNHPFPKYADGLKYLMIADITNPTSSAKNNVYATYIGGNRQYPIPANSTVRIVSLYNTQYMYFYGTDIGGTILTNWREYEVTNLTDEAIEYLASATTNPNPDALFRSSSFFDIANRYLIKADMVNPWTFLITMPVNTASMTVGSGLAYQLQLTDGEEHEITVDTFPTNAYGDDAHIQLLLGNGSSAVFKPPLYLNTALVQNAANNLTVKFRAGLATVYLDDTAAGYVVTVTAGTEAETLYDGVYGSTTTYVMFAPSTDNETIDLPASNDILVRYPKAIVGNGMDKTSVDMADRVRFYVTSTSFHQVANISNMSITTSKGIIYSDGKADVALTNCRIHDCSRSTAGDARAYLVEDWSNNMAVVNCVFDHNTDVEARYLIYAPQGGLVSGSTFSNNSAATMYCMTYYVAATLKVENCLFDVPATISNIISGGAGGGRVVLTGNTFTRMEGAAGLAGTLAGRVALAGKNYMQEQAIVGTTVTFVDGSVTDISGKTESTFVYSAYPDNTTVVGTNIYVVANEDNAAAVGGTATVLYSSALDGEYDSDNQPFTKSTTISGGGAGFVMRANGGMGVPVTTTTAGQTRSIDTLMADPNVSQITFGAVIDGQTVTIPDDTQITRNNIIINGSGMGDAAVTLNFKNLTAPDALFTPNYYNAIYLNGLHIKNSTFKNTNSTSLVIYATNCRFTGGTASVIGNYAKPYLVGCVIDGDWSGSCINMNGGGGNFYDCTFKASSNGALEIQGGNTVKNCTFISNVTAVTGYMTTPASSRPLFSDCVFNCTGANALRVGVYWQYTAAAELRNSTVNSGNIPITGYVSDQTGLVLTGTNVIKTKIYSTDGNGAHYVVLRDYTDANGVVQHSKLSGESAHHCTITGYTNGSTVVPIEIQGREISDNNDGAGRWVELSYVDILGATATNNGFACGSFSNCTFTNCAESGQNGAFFSTQHRGSYDGFSFYNCTFTNVLGSLGVPMYLMSGTSTLNNCTITDVNRNVMVHIGVVNVQGTCKIWGFYPASSTTSTGSIRIANGSTILLGGTWGVLPMGTVEIGKYINGVWTPGGSITAKKFDGTGAVTISGTVGTYIKVEDGAIVHDIAPQS